MAPQPSSLHNLVSSVMYHAERDKRKCDLHGGWRPGLIEWEGENQPEIVYDAPGKSRRICSWENSVQSWHFRLGLKRSLITLSASISTFGIVRPICWQRVLVLRCVGWRLLASEG